MEEVKEKMKNTEYTFKKSISREAKDMLLRILKHDPSERITLEQIFQHEFVLKHLDEFETNKDSFKYIPPEPEWDNDIDIEPQALEKDTQRRFEEDLINDPIKQQEYIRKMLAESKINTVDVEKVFFLRDEKGVLKMRLQMKDRPLPKRGNSERKNTRSNPLSIADKLHKINDQIIPKNSNNGQPKFSNNQPSALDSPTASNHNSAGGKDSPFKAQPLTTSPLKAPNPAPPLMPNTPNLPQQNIPPQEVPQASLRPPVHKMTPAVLSPAKQQTDALPPAEITPERSAKHPLDYYALEYKLTPAAPKPQGELEYALPPLLAPAGLQGPPVLQQPFPPRQGGLIDSPAAPPQFNPYARQESPQHVAKPPSLPVKPPEKDYQQQQPQQRTAEVQTIRLISAKSKDYLMTGIPQTLHSQPTLGSPSEEQLFRHPAGVQEEKSLTAARPEYFPRPHPAEPNQGGPTGQMLTSNGPQLLPSHPQPPPFTNQGFAVPTGPASGPSAFQQMTHRPFQGNYYSPPTNPQIAPFPSPPYEQSSFGSQQQQHGEPRGRPAMEVKGVGMQQAPPAPSPSPRSLYKNPSGQMSQPTLNVQQQHQMPMQSPQQASRQMAETFTFNRGSVESMENKPKGLPSFATVRDDSSLERNKPQRQVLKFIPDGYLRSPDGVYRAKNGQADTRENSIPRLPEDKRPEPSGYKPLFKQQPKKDVDDLRTSSRVGQVQPTLDAALPAMDRAHTGEFKPASTKPPSSTDRTYTGHQGLFRQRDPPPPTDPKKNLYVATYRRNPDSTMDMNTSLEKVLAQYPAIKNLTQGFAQDIASRPAPSSYTPQAPEPLLEHLRGTLKLKPESTSAISARKVGADSPTEGKEVIRDGSKINRTINDNDLYSMSKENPSSRPLTYEDQNKPPSHTVIRGTSGFQQGGFGTSTASSLSNKNLPIYPVNKPTEQKASPPEIMYPAKVMPPSTALMYPSNIKPQEVRDYKPPNNLAPAANFALGALLSKPNLPTYPLRRSSEGHDGLDKSNTVDYRDTRSRTDANSGNIVISSTQHPQYRMRREESSPPKHNRQPADDYSQDDSIYRPNYLKVHEQEDDKRYVHAITASVSDRSKSQSFGKRDLVNSFRPANPTPYPDGKLSSNERSASIAVPSTLAPAYNTSTQAHQEVSAQPMRLSNTGYSLATNQSPAATMVLGSAFKPTYVTASGEPPMRIVEVASTLPKLSNVDGQLLILNSSNTSSQADKPMNSDGNPIAITTSKSIASYTDLKSHPMMTSSPQFSTPLHPPKSEAPNTYAGSATFINKPSNTFKSEPIHNLPETGTSMGQTGQQNPASQGVHTYTGSSGTRTVGFPAPATSYGFTTSNTGGSNPPPGWVQGNPVQPPPTNQKPISSISDAKPSPLMGGLTKYATHTRQAPAPTIITSIASKTSVPEQQSSAPQMLSPITIKSNKEASGSYSQLESQAKPN